MVSLPNALAFHIQKWKMVCPSVTCLHCPIGAQCFEGDDGWRCEGANHLPNDPGKNGDKIGEFGAPNIPTVAIKYQRPNAAKQADFLGSGNMWKIGVNFSLKIHGIMCTSKKYIDGKSLLWKGKTCYKLGFREKLLEWFVSAGNHSVCWQLGYTKHIAISQHHQLNFGSNSKTTSRAESQHPTHLNPQRFSRKQSLQSRTNSTCFPFFFPTHLALTTRFIFTLSQFPWHQFARSA